MIVCTFKILLKNAQILLENHKCETCPELLAVFKPYKVASNSERQQTWYQKNTEKRCNTSKLLLSIDRIFPVILPILFDFYRTTFRELAMHQVSGNISIAAAKTY